MENIACDQPSHLHEHCTRLGDVTFVPVYPLESDRR